MREFLKASIGKLLLLAAGGIIALGGAEIVVRKLEPEWPRTYAFSETRGWETLPNLDLTHRVSPLEGGDGGPVRIRTNSLGLRMTREIGEKAPGVRRVAVIGDSFTFGAWVHEESLYTVVMERRLAEGGAGEVEVVNLGVPGYGVHQEEVMLVEKGLPLEPDLVILAIYPGNDLPETLGLHRRLYDDETGGTREAPDHHIVDGRMVALPTAAAVPQEIRLSGLKGWLRTNLRLYPFLVSRVKANPELESALIRFGLIAPPKRELLPPAERLARLWSGGVGLVNFLRETPPALEEAWKLVLGHLDEIHRLCAAEGAELVIVHIPSKVQLAPEKLEAEKRLLGLRDEDLDLDQPGRRLLAWGRENGVPVLDLAPVLARTRDPEALYFREDNHWNDQGNEVAGAAIAEFLLARKLIPATAP